MQWFHFLVDFFILPLFISDPNILRSHFFCCFKVTEFQINELSDSSMLSKVWSSADQMTNATTQARHSERANTNIEKSNSKKKIVKMQKPWHGMDGDFGTGYSTG